MPAQIAPDRKQNEGLESNKEAIPAIVIPTAPAAVFGSVVIAAQDVVHVESAGWNRVL
jgi:hypothetical protein